MSKIIICSPQLGIAPESNSGGEVYDREVIKALCNKGIKVIVILPYNKKYVPHNNLKVYYLPVPFVWPPYLFNLLLIPHLFYIYRKEKFNLLRVHSPYFSGLGCLFFKLFYPSIPLVAIYHHLERKFFFNLIDKLFIKSWDKIITVSEFTKNNITARYNLNPDKIKVIYNGFDNKIQPQKKKICLIKKYQLNGNKVLLFFGGLKTRKNIFFLLDVIKSLKYRNLKLIIAGSGRLYNKLVNKVRKLKIKSKVEFTGYVPEKGKADIYNLADIFVFPSKLEGFGMPIIEAAACGISAVVSDVSSLKELVVSGKTGYLAKLNDIEDWKLKVEKLLNNETLRKKMGKEAQKFANQFSWSKSAEKQIKLYKKILTINHQS